MVGALPPSRSTRHADYVLRRLEADVFPEIGGMPVVGVSRGQHFETPSRRSRRGLLADGPVPSKQVKADSDGAGFAWGHHPPSTEGYRGGGLPGRRRDRKQGFVVLAACGEAWSC